MKNRATRSRPGRPIAFAPALSEQQLEDSDHHDQADDEDDACGSADEFQHAVSPVFSRL
ncbi:hypothetical protein [Pseudomonas lopnurensis]|uniref:hypothetical protein n=1 Tax=Pseudomonas lopnurensis TaxID=1477517 RepID=UPI0018799830|nr:hypothetical protein [Pseudomonas lopnurensis]MBE7373491.1 hypothetical protein [Pseudomonas lopnurensis]